MKKSYLHNMIIFLSIFKITVNCDLENSFNTCYKNILDVEKILSETFNDPQLNKKITIKSRPTKVQDIIELIALSSDLNFIIEDNVKGDIGKINFKNSTVGHILKFVCKNNDPELALIKDMNVWKIMTKQNAEKHIKQVLENNLTNRVFYLNNVQPNEKFKELAEKTWHNIIGKDNKGNSTLIIDPDRKKIFLRGNESYIEEFKCFLKELDIPITQVRIDAIIVFCEKNYNFDFGINWSGIYNRLDTLKCAKQAFNFIGLGGTLADFPTPTKSDFPNNEDLLVNPFHFALNLFTRQFHFAQAANLKPTSDTMVKIPFVFGGKDLNLRRLNLVLNAAEVESKAKIVSRPSVVTNDNETAKILIGKKLPIQTGRLGDVLAAGALFDVTSLNYQDIGISLEVFPTVSADKKTVKLEIFLEESEFVSGRTQTNERGIMTDPPVIDIIRVRNKVSLQNGQTVVIGGLTVYDDREGINSVPFLSRIPIIGKFFFTGTAHAKREFEQYVFITPTILEEC